MTNLADAGVLESIGLLARREASSRELVEACLDRIRERNGEQSHEGDPQSVNAWVRVYEDDAFVAAGRADARLAAGNAPGLCGVPVGLKDLYAVAGKPLTASSRLLDDVPERVVPGLAATRGGRHGAARPPAHARVRGGRNDRPGRQSVGARPLGGRLERRLGGRARGADGPGRDGHGHGGVAAHPVGCLRHVDDQADTRSGANARPRAARADLRPRRADGANPGGLRAVARRAQRCRRAAAAVTASPRCRLAPLRARGARPRRGRRIRGCARRVS